MGGNCQLLLSDPDLTADRGADPNLSGSDAADGPLPWTSDSDPAGNGRTRATSARHAATAPSRVGPNAAARPVQPSAAPQRPSAGT